MKITLSSVVVNSQDRARRFYTEQLGFVVKTDVPVGDYHWLTVASPEGVAGVELALEPAAHAAAHEYQQALYRDGIPRHRSSLLTSMPSSRLCAAVASCCGRLPRRLARSPSRCSMTRVGTGYRCTRRSSGPPAQSGLTGRGALGANDTVPLARNGRTRAVVTAFERVVDSVNVGVTETEGGGAVRIAVMTPDDWGEVAGVYREGILTGDATFETEVPSWAHWEASHLEACRFVAREGDVVVGWAALSPVSRRACYRGVAEVSVYVRESARGRGVGRALLDRLVEASEEAHIWTLQGATFPENVASLRLQAACGFRVVGRRERIAQLHGRWRDTVLTERRSLRVGSG